tara:strand:+ start:6583 stop:8910 length:2328 start_codon:yes stop_codon:yes gene_type:complete
MSGPVSPPLATTESGTTVRVQPTNTLEFNGADFTVTQSGSKASIAIDSTGAGAALTATQVGFGDSSNLLTGNSKFRYLESAGQLILTGTDDTNAEFIIERSAGSSQTIALENDSSASPVLRVNIPPNNAKELMFDSQISDTAVTGGTQGFRFNIGNTSDTSLSMLTIGTTDSVSYDVVFNEDSLNDYDIRMEGSTNANLFVLKGTGDNIGIGTFPSTSVERLHVSGTSVSADAIVRIQTESTVAQKDSYGPIIELTRTYSDGNGQDGAELARIKFMGEDDAGNVDCYGDIRMETYDAGAGSEDGVMRFYVTTQGTQTEYMRITARDAGSPEQKGVVINEGSADISFRVESDGLNPAFMVNSGQDNVGVGTDPDSDTRFHVKGGGGKASTVRIQTDDDDAAVGPVVELFKNSASPDTGDDLGQILFSGNDSAGAKQNYFQIKGEIRDKTSGSDDGELIFIGPSNSTDIEFVRMSKTVGVVVNEGGGGIVDFRVEGSNDANLISTDAANDNIGIGRVPDSSDAKVQIDVGNSTQRALDIISDDADADAAPTLRFHRESSSPAVQDATGQIEFSGKDLAGQQQVYSRITSHIVDPSNLSEDGDLRFKVMVGGNEQEFMRMNNFGIVINELSVDQNFKVESNGNASMFTIDGGLNRVSVGAVPVSGGATFQVPDNTISHYCNVNTIRSDAVGIMVMVNEDNQGQMWVHDSSSAHTIQLVEGGVKGMHFQFMSTDGGITIDPQGSDTLNGGTASLSRNTNFEIYDVFCYANGKWALSNPA